VIEIKQAYCDVVNATPANANKKAISVNTKKKVLFLEAVQGFFDGL
jgi:hypothetical protein